MRQLILFSVIIIAVVSFMGLVEQAGAAPQWRFDANVYANVCHDVFNCYCDDANDIAIGWDAFCPFIAGLPAIQSGAVEWSSVTRDIALGVCYPQGEAGPQFAPINLKVICYDVK